MQVPEKNLDYLCSMHAVIERISKSKMQLMKLLHYSVESVGLLHAFFCSACFHSAQSAVNIFHIAEEWRVRHCMYVW